MVGVFLDGDSMVLGSDVFSGGKSGLLVVESDSESSDAAESCSSARERNRIADTNNSGPLCVYK